MVWATPTCDAAWENVCDADSPTMDSKRYMNVEAVDSPWAIRESMVRCVGVCNSAS